MRPRLRGPEQATEVEVRAVFRALPDATPPADLFNASMGHAETIEAGARVGDWVEVLGSSGEPIRRGEIVELLGGPGREHFQVRWDENYESMVFPRPGVRIVRQVKD